MIEAVENQYPQLVVVDELLLAARVRRRARSSAAAPLIATHGNTLLQLMNDPERNLLLGRRRECHALGPRGARARGGEADAPTGGPSSALRSSSAAIRTGSSTTTSRRPSTRISRTSRSRRATASASTPKARQPSACPSPVRSTPLAGCRQKGGEASATRRSLRATNSRAGAWSTSAEKDASGRAAVGHPVDETHRARLGGGDLTPCDAAAPRVRRGRARRRVSSR